MVGVAEVAVEVMSRASGERFPIACCRRMAVSISLGAMSLGVSLVVSAFGKSFKLLKMKKVPSPGPRCLLSFFGCSIGRGR